MPSPLLSAVKNAGGRLLGAASKVSNGTLFRFGYQLLPSPTVTVVRPWEYDPSFLEILDEIKGHTLVDPIRCFMLYQFARATRTVPGEVAELGVYRGGTGRLLSMTLPEKLVHLCDTFDGMPERDTRYDPAAYSRDFLADTSLNEVREYLADRPNVKLHPGTFPESAGDLQQRRFSFVHIDADIYPSTVAACEFFYSRMAVGGVMLFDDYGNCPGVVKAAEEFFADMPEVPCYLPSGQGVVTRLPA